MKPDFFVARATSKTFKIIWLIHNHLSSEGHLTFMDNPIIRIAAKFPNKNSHYYGLLLLWTLSHGLEVVCIERVTGVLPYKDLEAGRPQLMRTLSSAPTWETGAENSPVECYYYYYCCCCCCCFCRWWYLLLGLLVLRASILSWQTATSVIT